MKISLFLIVTSICTVPILFNDNTDSKLFETSSPTGNVKSSDSNMISLQQQTNDGKMSCAVFKAQDYCRAELENFDFDAHFVVLSATVYFSGGNFKPFATGAITSSSLKPIKDLMSQCTPGTIVIFEDIKVKGPDEKVRTLQSVSYRLY